MQTMFEGCLATVEKTVIETLYSRSSKPRTSVRLTPSSFYMRFVYQTLW